MKKAGYLALVLVILIPMLVYSEDIILVKHAHKPEPPRETSQYKVKPGDTLSKILLKDFGARPEDLQLLYKQFRQYNPTVRNLNRIHPDRQVIIPKLTGTGKRTAKKTEPAKSSRSVYVIKKGQHLAMVLRELYGLPDDLIFHVYLEKIRKLNPGIGDLNMLTAGQKIVLPDIKVPDGTKASLAQESRKDLKQRKIRKVIIQDIDDGASKQEGTPADHEAGSNAEGAAAQGGKGTGNQVPIDQAAGAGNANSSGGLGGEGQWDIVTPIIGAGTKQDDAKERAVKQLLNNTVLPSLREMGINSRDQGTYFLPLTGDKSVSLDTREIPIIDLDNGTRIILDLNSKIPLETRRLIEQAYPSTKIVSGPAEGLEAVMDKVLQASGFFSINKDSGPILVGEDEKVRFFGKWVVYKDISRRNIIIVNILTDDEYKTPEPVRNYALRFGINLVEMGGKTGAPRKDGSVEGLGHSSEKLLAALDLAYEKQKELELVSIDSVKVSFTAPLLIGKTIFSEELPDKTMLDLLLMRGYKVINPKAETLVNLFEALGQKKQGPPIRVIIAKGRTELDLPAVEVNHKLFLERAADKDIEAYLSTAGLKIFLR